MIQLIRCTQKLQKEMGLKKSELSTANADNSRLGEWYANLIYIERRKCVVFVNKKTLFNFIVPNVKRYQIEKLGELFLSFFVNKVLFGMKLDFITLEILDEYEKVWYAKTGDKSLLGSMNDIIWNYKYHISEEGGLFQCDLLGIIQRLNKMPFSTLQWKYPIDALKSVYNIKP